MSTCKVFFFHRYDSRQKRQFWLEARGVMSDDGPSLTSELCAHAFAWLADARDLLNAAETCATWRHAVETNEEVWTGIVRSGENEPYTQLFRELKGKALYQKARRVRRLWRHPEPRAEALPTGTASFR